MNITTNEYGQPWSASQYLVLDLEGTGAQHRENEGIVHIAGVVVKDGVVTGEHFSHLLDPEISIPFFISRIHGITDKETQGMPKFKEVKDDILAFIEDRIVVSHNASVERRVLRFRLPEYEPSIMLDTLKMSRAAYPGEKGHSLDAVIKRLQLESLISSVDSKKHSALYDAMATAHAFVSLATRLAGATGTLQQLAPYALHH